MYFVYDVYNNNNNSLHYDITSCHCWRTLNKGYASDSLKYRQDASLEDGVGHKGLRVLETFESWQNL